MQKKQQIVRSRMSGLVLVLLVALVGIGCCREDGPTPSPPSSVRRTDIMKGFRHNATAIPGGDYLNEYSFKCPRSQDRDVNVREFARILSGLPGRENVRCVLVEKLEPQYGSERSGYHGWMLLYAAEKSLDKYEKQFEKLGAQRVPAKDMQRMEKCLRIVTTEKPRTRKKISSLNPPNIFVVSFYDGDIWRIESWHGLDRFMMEYYENPELVDCALGNLMFWIRFELPDTVKIDVGAIDRSYDLLADWDR